MPVVARAADAEQPYACEGGHVQGDERVDRLPPSLEPAGLVFETDPEAPGYHGSLLNIANQEDFDLEIDPEENPTVLAAVTGLLSRPDMMSNQKARAAVRKEVEGLLQKGMWELETVPERNDLIARAKTEGIKIHLGQPMSICNGVRRNRSMMQEIRFSCRHGPCIAEPAGMRLWLHSLCSRDGNKDSLMLGQVALRFGMAY